MSMIPEDVVTEHDLSVWFELQKELAAIKAREMLLRMRIFRHYFKTPKEGTNTFVLPDQYQLKAVYPYDRKVLIEQLQAAVQQKVFEGVGIKIDDLIKWEPSLVIKPYRELTAEQLQLMDQFLEIKPGAPSMKIEPPKKAKETAA
jgi:hypothetical protein